MPLYKDMMGGGTSAGQARALGGSVASAVSAAGTVITDATDLTASINYVSTAGANSGVQLYSMTEGEDQLVYNGGANAVRVYPGSATIAINQLPVGTAHILAVNTGCRYVQLTTTRVIAILSA